MPKPSKCFSTSLVISQIFLLASIRCNLFCFWQKSITGLVWSLKTLSLLAMDSSLSSALPLVFPLSSSLFLSSSSVHSKQMTDRRFTHLAISFSHTSMFSWPLGKPSSRYLPPKLRLSIFSLISFTINQLDINFPSFMMDSSSWPNLDPVFTSSLRRSPVDRWTKPYFLTKISHCLNIGEIYVPLPEPGPPKTNTISAGLGGLILAAVSWFLSEEQTQSLLLVASMRMQLFLSSKLFTMGRVQLSKVSILFFMVSGLSSVLPLVLARSVMRSMSVCVGQSKQMRFLTMTLSARRFSKTSQFS